MFIQISHFQESYVWNYVYQKSDDDKKVFCIVCFNNDKKTELCMNTKTISRHLKDQHGIVSQPVVRQSEQTTLSGSTSIDFQKKATCDKWHLHNKLSLAIATSTASNIFVENVHFREFLKELNPFYKPPSRNQISENIKLQYEECLAWVKQKIEQAPFISLTVDFWSKDVTGYLGIAANILNAETKEMESFCICLEPVPYPHTSEVCFFETNKALSQFGLNSVDNPKISFITTDNGSNMKKAYSKLKTMPLPDNSFQFKFEAEVNEDDFLIPIDMSKRLQCIAHALNNSLKASVEGSKKFHIDPCETTKAMLVKVLHVCKKVFYKSF